MSGIDPDVLKTVSPAPAGDTRRLTTVDKIKAALGETSFTFDEELEGMIDQLSDRLARIAGLAADSSGGFPTFGQETLRATWYAYPAIQDRDDILLLPWRPAITVTTITEAGIALVEGTDYRVVDRWRLQRLCSGVPSCWDRCAEVVVEMTAGWVLPGGVPPGLEGAVIDQLKFNFRGRDRDPALRSESVQNVGSATWAVIGGDSISANGLLWSLERAVGSYSRVSV